jgi:hypothetical protein
MSNRGSLRQVILYVAEQLDKGHYEFYGIMHNPKGKYYTALSPTELDEKDPDKTTEHLRLVFLGTKKELATFCKYEQRDLFKEEQNVEP